MGLFNRITQWWMIQDITKRLALQQIWVCQLPALTEDMEPNHLQLTQMAVDTACKAEEDTLIPWTTEDTRLLTPATKTLTTSLRTWRLQILPIPTWLSNQRQRQPKEDINMSPHCIRKIPERRLMRNMLSKDHLQEWPLLENSNLIALCSVRGLPITLLTIPMITRFKRIPLTIHLIRQKGEINLTLIQKQLNQDLRF